MHVLFVCRDTGKCGCFRGMRRKVFGFEPWQHFRCEQYGGRDRLIYLMSMGGTRSTVTLGTRGMGSINTQPDTGGASTLLNSPLTLPLRDNPVMDAIIQRLSERLPKQ